MKTQTINPYTGEKLKEYVYLNEEEIESAIKISYDTYEYYWKATESDEKKKLILDLKETLIECENEFSQIIVDEMGKKLFEAKAEIKKCANLCEFYAENFENFLSDEIIESDYHTSLVCYRPLGAILGVMPWNFPFWQVFRFAVPTLLAGNTILLKHSSSVSGCALKIEEAFQKAGFRTGVFQTLIMKSDHVKNIIADSRIAAVSLTGSEKAGRSVTKYAGENLKKCVLELGGSDGYIILNDADLNHAVETIVSGRILNSGQSCISPKRLIIEDQIYSEFKTKLLKKLEDISFCNPSKSKEKKSNTLAPMSREDLRDELHKDIQDSIQKGAKCLIGGEIPHERGSFYPFTVLENPPKDSSAYSKELFGPVISIFKAKNAEDAIKIANDTSYGLGAAIFSSNQELSLDLAKNKIEAGSCFVNDFVKSNQVFPFGGIKNSGYGRELTKYGIREFTNIKTIALSKQ